MLIVAVEDNNNFGTVSVCHAPKRNRTGQIITNFMTGCVPCASGDGSPIWWDDPVQEISNVVSWLSNRARQS